MILSLKGISTLKREPKQLDFALDFALIKNLYSYWFEHKQSRKSAHSMQFLCPPDFGRKIFAAKCHVRNYAIYANNHCDFWSIISPIPSSICIIVCVCDITLHNVIGLYVNNRNPTRLLWQLQPQS
jgi:hypothetical protein